MSEADKITLTNEEWKDIENKLSYTGACVNLKVDGYQISIMVVRRKSFHNVLQIFVENHFKLKWLMEDCEIRRKFCQPHKRNLLSADEKRKLRKEIKSKKRQDDILNNCCYTYYDSCWSSFRTMKAHFIKNCNSIKLIAN